MSVAVALIGFSKFERATFESFFRLATQRSPAYVLATDVAQCAVAIANAEDEAGVAELMRHGKLARCIALGSTPRPGVAQQLPRPINLMLVVRALDALVKTHSITGEPTPSPAVQRVLNDLASVTAALAPDVDTRALAAKGAPAPPRPAATMPKPLPPQAAAAERQGMDHILVVDDSDIALRFMATHLQRFGFEVHLVRSGAEAIERVARRHFEFVFLDVMMEGLDGFQTCKQIKRSTYPDNRPPPTVVMLTSRGTAVDKLRGTMAGADTYLTKPLSENDLLKVVGDREVSLHAYKNTAAAANTLI
jgi:two-component system, cell cycle response regulator